MKWSSDILLSRSSFVIPRPGVAGVRLTGVLEHVIPDHSAGRRLALIIHGAVGYNVIGSDRSCSEYILNTRIICIRSYWQDACHYTHFASTVVAIMSQADKQVPF